MNILFIPGVTIATIKEFRKKLDNMYNTEILEEKKNISTQYEFFDTIPNTFTTLDDTWPMTTNLSCGICTLLIKSRPFPIPVNKTNGTYECAPNPVCDATCASRYIKKYLNKTNFNVYMHMLKEITSIFHKIKCKGDVPESLSHLNLRKFGGDYSEIEYENENKKILDRYLLDESISLN